MVSFSFHSSSSYQDLNSKKDKIFSEIRGISKEWGQHECCPLLKRKTEAFTECLSRCQQEAGEKLNKNIKELEKHSKEIRKLDSYRSLWEKLFPQADSEAFYKYKDRCCLRLTYFLW